MIFTSNYNIDNTGSKDVTRELQELIMYNEDVYISAGTYLVSSLYISSNRNIYLDPEATILGTTDETKYDLINTRVAGIEMKWYPAIINIMNATNVTISGLGTIKGAGKYFYEKYWGKDTKSGMRADYDEKGIRWACDYDCARVRNILITNSDNIKIMDLNLIDSGFWNLHILYSHDIYVNNLNIVAPEVSPSTDGIDIDSSYNIRIENVKTHTNDDSICIKSGRDYDGLRVNIPSHDIIIRDCKIYNGYGITVGSEVSGGIHNIRIENIEYYGTDCAFRIKSSRKRKGYVKNIIFKNIKCRNVKYLCHIFLDWNKEYNNCVIPSNITEVRDHWLTLTKEVSDDILNTKVSNIKFDNISSTCGEEYDGISRLFTIVGFEPSQIEHMKFMNMNINMKEYGIIKNAENIQFENCNIITKIDYDPNNDDFDNR